MNNFVAANPMGTYTKALDWIALEKYVGELVITYTPLLSNIGKGTLW